MESVAMHSRSLSCTTQASAVSGLGISFTGSPPLQAVAALPTISSKFQEREMRRPRSMTSLYDARRTMAEMDVLERDSISSSEQQRRVRIASGTPQVLGAYPMQHDYAYQQQSSSFSPDSEASSNHTVSSVDSRTYSIATLSSLPSSTYSAGGYAAKSREQPTMARSTAMRHAQSVDNLRLSEKARRQPPSTEMVMTLSNPLYDYSQPAASRQEPAQPSSRLPPFLRERMMRQQGLARPKSMLELGELHRQQQQREFYSPPEQEEAREHSMDAEEQAYAAGGESPESVPSSAGALQRRHMERQIYDDLDLQGRGLGGTGVAQSHGHERRGLSEEEGKMEKSKRMLRTRSMSFLTGEQVDLPPADGRQSRLAHHGHGRSRSDLTGIQSYAAAQKLRKSDAPVGLGMRRGSMDLLPPSDDLYAMSGRPRQQADNQSVISKQSSARSTLDSGSGKSGPGLARQNTLLTAGANPTKRNKELDRLLAPTSKRAAAPTPAMSADSPFAHTPASSAPSAATPSSGRAASRASTHPSVAASTSGVMLEQAKKSSKARVELDLLLDSELVVEGGRIKGKIEVRVRKQKDEENETWLGKPKIRVVGFEELASQDNRHIFFHHASSIAALQSEASTPTRPLPCFDSREDSEGYCRARPGVHSVPFELRLPIGKGAKGAWKGKQGVVRYIAIASIKLKSSSSDDRSIAHFYRHIDIFPYLNPAVVLAPAKRPLVAATSKSLFMGGSGKVQLSAQLHRATWVAGQRCYVGVRVANESSKKIKSLTLTLLRVTTVYKSGRDNLHPLTEDIGAQTIRKKVAETILEMGKKGHRTVTAKGTWMGVEPEETCEFQHSLLVPSDALSIARGKFLEVSYELKISVGASLSADISVELPITVVDFVSLDPPPGHSTEGGVARAPASHALSKCWSMDQLRVAIDATEPVKTISRPAAAMDRMASFDSLRLEDLNDGRGPSRLSSHPMTRLDSATSEESVRSSNAAPASRVHTPLGAQYSGPVNQHMLPSGAGPARAVVDRAKERQLRHQQSLECISSAIASATNRHQTAMERGPSALRSEVKEPSEYDENENYDDDDDDLLPPEAAEGDLYYGGGSYGAFDNDRGSSVRLDDLEDIPDEMEYFQRGQAPADDESEDELEAYIQGSRFDGEEDDELEASTRHAPAPARAAPRSPAGGSHTQSRLRSYPSSPARMGASGSSLQSSSKSQLGKIGFATPASPIKASVSPTPNVAPSHRTRTASSNSVVAPRPRSVSTASPTKELPATPLSPRAGKILPSSSLKRASHVAKKPSSRTLRHLEGMSAAIETMPAESCPDVDSSSTHSGSSSERVRTPPQAFDVDESDMPFVQAAQTSPRRGITSPTLSSQNKAVLPSVRSKVAALERRQHTIASLNPAPGRITSAGPSAMARTLSAAHSVSGSSEASFADPLARANSVVSFKAPLLRRRAA